MFSMVYNHLKITFETCQNKPFISTDTDGPLPESAMLNQYILKRAYTGPFTFLAHVADTVVERKRQ